MAVTLVIGCSEETTPESAVRDRLDALIEAVEHNEVVALNDFLSADYRDALHADRRAVIQTILGYRLRHRGVHLFSHVASISVDPERRGVDCTLYLAMTGVPLQSFDALVQLRADLYRFNVSWIDEDGEWRVESARWQRVDPQSVRDALF